MVETVRGKAEKREGKERKPEERKPEERSLARFACRSEPPNQVVFGELGGGRGSAWRSGGVAWGLGNVPVLPEVSLVAQRRIWSGLAVTVVAEMVAALCGVPGRGKGTGG